MLLLWLLFFVGGAKQQRISFPSLLLARPPKTHTKNNHSKKDLIFAHRPDDNTPVEETVRAFNWVIDQGMAHYWGTSEWSAAQLEAAWEVAERLGLQGPAMEQPQYNVFERSKVETEFAPLYEAKGRGLGLTTWSPLASGVLTGKYSKVGRVCVFMMTIVGVCVGVVFVLGSRSCRVLVFC